MSGYLTMAKYITIRMKIKEGRKTASESMIFKAYSLGIVFVLHHVLRFFTL